MNRRQWMQTLAAAPLAAQGAPPKPVLDVGIVRLNLRHTWTTTMSSSQYRDTLQVRYTRDGVTGIGEGAPIVRYGEDAESAKRAVLTLRDLVVGPIRGSFPRLWPRSSAAWMASSPPRQLSTSRSSIGSGRNWASRSTATSAWTRGMPR